MSDVENSGPRRSDLVKEKSVTMEYFVESRHLDAATADMLKSYDNNGDGYFSKDEVVAIILDLRESMRANETLGASNKLFKRLLIASFIFCALLLTSMFGLSYTVAVITANTEVQSDGTLLSKDGTSVIATASAASKFDFGKNDNGQYCIPPEEMQAITEQVFSGRNVLVELGEFTENHKLVEQLQANGADLNEATGVICFWLGGDENHSICLLPTKEDCVAVDSQGRRKLTVDRQLKHEHFPPVGFPPAGFPPGDQICFCYDPVTDVCKTPTFSTFPNRPTRWTCPPPWSNEDRE